MLLNLYIVKGLPLVTNSFLRKINGPFEAMITRNAVYIISGKKEGLLLKSNNSIHQPFIFCCHVKSGDCKSTSGVPSTLLVWTAPLKISIVSGVILYLSLSPSWRKICSICCRSFFSTAIITSSIFSPVNYIVNNRSAARAATPVFYSEDCHCRLQNLLYGSQFFFGLEDPAGNQLPRQQVMFKINSFVL